MGGTFFCDVSANVWDADARNQYRCLLPVFSCRREECYGPMNAKCLTIQSCKGFVYLYMVMGKINHWSKSHIFSKTLSYMFGGRGGKKKRGNQGCSRLHWSEVSSCQGSARVQSNERLVHCHMSLLFLCGRHHSWEVGWAFNISIYPQSSCAPESSNQQTPATTPTSAMIPPTSQSAPVISCGPNRLRPLSMPSAETASVSGFLVFGFFWAVQSKLVPPTHKHPSWEMESPFTAWFRPTSCHFSSHTHTFLHIHH